MGHTWGAPQHILVKSSVENILRTCDLSGQREYIYTGAVPHCDINLCLVALSIHSVVLTVGEAWQTVKILKRGISRNNRGNKSVYICILCWGKSPFLDKTDSLFLYQFIACIRFDIRPLNKTLFLHKAAYGRADKWATRADTWRPLCCTTHTNTRTHTQGWREEQAQTLQQWMILMVR